MDLIKIGKFISLKRKEKGITQSELAEKLYITDRAISKWENGICLPDAGTMPELCKILDITINDLMSGEKIKKEKYQEKFEENIVNTIDYSTKRINKYGNVIGLLLVVFGLFISAMVELTALLPCASLSEVRYLFFSASST